MKRTTVRAIYKALQKYPISQGATFREIHNVIKKSDKGRTRRSQSSVKLAIARAVQQGKIRMPKGWQGFKGINLDGPGNSNNRNQSGRSARASSTRRASRHTGKSEQSVSLVTNFHTPQGRAFSMRTKGKKAMRKGRNGVKRGRGAYRKGRVMKKRGKNVKRGRKNKLKKNKRQRANRSDNSNRANTSDNNNPNESAEETTTSLWKTYPCIIS